MARADPVATVARRLRAELKLAGGGSKAAVQNKLPSLFRNLWAAQPDEYALLHHQKVNLELLHQAWALYPMVNIRKDWSVPPDMYLVLVLDDPDRLERLRELWPIAKPLWFAQRLIEHNQYDALDEYLLEGAPRTEAWAIVRYLAAVRDKHWQMLARAVLQDRGATEADLSGLPLEQFVSAAQDVLQLPEHIQQYNLWSIDLPTEEYVRLIRQGFAVQGSSLADPRGRRHLIRAAQEQYLTELLTSLLPAVLARFVIRRW